MCGITGVIRLARDADWRMTPDVAQRMVHTLRFRGPDGHGEWYAPDGRVWFGHSRLAIIDLAHGQEPMPNEDDTVWTTFNGEIYNHLALRAELEALGHTFRTRCDTEVVPIGYRAWGAQGLLERLQGMFGLAIYDIPNQKFLLARDRLGIKPMYWSVAGDVLLFGSEIKAMLQHPLKRSIRPDTTVFAQFLSTRYIPAPRTAFEGIWKLPLAHCIEIDLAHPPRPADIEPRRYWQLSYARNGHTPRFEEALEQVDELFHRTVDMHMMSDVPLGAQLSGGVDSSLIVSHMALARREKGITDPIHTYSVGFDVASFSELPFANLVAQRYGTQHHEITVDAHQFLDAFARMSWVYDEPVGEAPGVPTYLMCAEAKKRITVMLTGEGGDESFGGYSKYAFDQYSRYLDWMPAGARRELLRGAAHLIPFGGRRVRSIVEILSLADPAARYGSWYGAFDTASVEALLHPDYARLAAQHPIAERVRQELEGCDSREALHRLLYADIHLRLVDDLLVKGDRMAMAASIEGRVPFLDHKLVEFAASLPPSYKVDGLKTKILLKKLAERYVPHEAIYRRKVGFTVPLTVWFRGPLQPVLRGLLLSDRALQRGYYKPEAVRRTVEDHLDGRVDREMGLWAMIAQEMWHRLYVDADGSESAGEALREDVLALAGWGAAPAPPIREIALSA